MFFLTPGSLPLFFFFFLRFILHPGVRRLFLFNVRIVLVYTFLFVMIRIPCERFQLSNSGGVGIGQSRIAEIL